MVAVIAIIPQILRLLIVVLVEFPGIIYKCFACVHCFGELGAFTVPRRSPHIIRVDTSILARPYLRLEAMG